MLRGLGAAALFCGLAIGTIARAAAPACSLVPGWNAQGAVRSYNPDNLFEYMDGNAEGYLLYGFQGMQGVTCEKGPATLILDISDFGDADSAYGMFSNQRDPGHPTTKIGAGGQIVPRRAIFVKGKYYVEIAANPEGDYTSVLQQLSTAIDKTLEGSTEPPTAVSWLPTERQQSVRMVPESVLGIRLLRRGYVGQYDIGKAFVVLDDSVADATETMKKLRAKFTANTVAKIADEAFQAKDQYLGSLCIFRKGRFVGGYSNLGEGQDGVALSTALSQRIP